MAREKRTDTTRKTVTLPNDVWEIIAAYERDEGCDSGNEAIRRLVRIARPTPDSSAGLRAEIARLRARLAAAGLDPDKGEGGTT